MRTERKQVPIETASNQPYQLTVKRGFLALLIMYASWTAAKRDQHTSRFDPGLSSLQCRTRSRMDLSIGTFAPRGSSGHYRRWLTDVRAHTGNWFRVWDGWPWSDDFVAHVFWFQCRLGMDFCAYRIFENGNCNPYAEQCVLHSCSPNGLDTSCLESSGSAPPAALPAIADSPY